jgi:DNA polymerase-3 subunit alpha
MSKIKFVGLHAHSGLSILDGFGAPSEHLDFAQENGLEAFAFTEHGNMNSLSFHYLHHQKMKKEGRAIKPIFGIEAYFHDSIEEWKNLKESKNSGEEEETKDNNFEDESESKSAIKKKDPLKFRSHLVLLAKNKQGLDDLFKLVSLSSTGDNYYYFPRMDFSMLKQYGSNLVVSSACLGSHLMNQYWFNRHKTEKEVFDLMIQKASEFKDIFGKNYYLELQWNNIPEQHWYNNKLIQISKILDIELISTCDSHYPRPSDWKDREIYKRLKFLNQKNFDNNLPATVDDIGYEIYPKNGDQMWESYKKYSSNFPDYKYDDDLIMESLERTYDIAMNQIESFLPDTSIKLPSFAVPIDRKADDVLKEMCYEALVKKGLDKEQDYVTRLDYELSVINAREFGKYFLTTKLITDINKEYCISYNGRGSASGSLVSYLLGILQVDPLKWNTSFERFLRPSDTSLPDIDIDITSRFKEISLDVYREKWGKDTVVNISNLNSFKIKSLLKDISKFYNIPFQEVNDVSTKMIQEAMPEAKARHGITAGVYDPTLEEILEFSPSFKDFIKKYPFVFEHVKTLLGELRTISTHAGGIIILDDVSSALPLINVKNNLQTPWIEGQAARHLEALGYVKFDLLGLSTLDQIEACVESILRRSGRPHTIKDVIEWYNENLHPDKIDFNIEKVYENVFDNMNYLSIFQFTESGAQNFATQFKPRTLLDICVITSIYRPGPLSSNIDKKYIEAKENPDKVVYEHPIIKSILSSTHGMIIFQEDIPKVLCALGKNISQDEGQLVRKILIKKGLSKGLSELFDIIERFHEGCLEKGLTRNQSDKIMKSLEEFAKYAFSYNHSLAYSMISYQCAYLFTFYQDDWCSSYLDAQTNKSADDKQKAILNVQKLGYNIELPNVNKSSNKWEILEDNTLLAPLNMIKGMGDKSILQITNNQPFQSIEDFLFNENISYSSLNKRKIRDLGLSDALKCLQDSRFQNKKHFVESLEYRTDKKVNRNNFPQMVKFGTLKKNQLSLFEEDKPEEPIKYDDYTRQENIVSKLEILGYYDLQLILNQKRLNFLEKNDIKNISSYSEEDNTVWFIPIEKVEKISKNGKKHYVELIVLDDTFNKYKVFCFGIFLDSIELNHMYIAEINSYNFFIGYTIFDAITKMIKI